MRQARRPGRQPRPWLRRLERVFWLAGLVLLGHAVLALASARIYQARQARALEKGQERDPLVLGLLEVPRLGISVVVREGVDERTLKVAVGHVPGTPRPGERGNVALAGHRDSFFRKLRNVRRRDLVVFHTPGKSYDYRVEMIEVVGPEATRVLASSDRDLLTLVTCYPFDFVGNAPKRFIVKASAVAPAGREPDVLEARHDESRRRPEVDQASEARGAGRRAAP